jgi:hypothetical protein
MFNVLSDKLTDSHYIHNLVQGQMKYDESDENPDYYGLGTPKPPVPAAKVSTMSNSTASPIQLNTTSIIQAGVQHSRQGNSRVKNGRLVPEGHTRCAKEGEVCQCQGTVTYVVDYIKWHNVRPKDNQGQP